MTTSVPPPVDTSGSEQIADNASAPAEANPVSEAEPKTAALPLDGDILPIAGAAGFGVLALAGVGLALRRRRRNGREEYVGEYEDERRTGTVDAHPEPTFARTVTPTQQAPAPAIAESPLPSGFDLSRFGRHVQAAYRGPTPDNPSLSLRHRLRRASGMDAMERNRTAEGRAPEPTALRREPQPNIAPQSQPGQPAPASGVSVPVNSGVMFRRANDKPKAKPVFQS